MKHPLQVDQVSKILGSLILVIGFAAYHTVYQVTGEKADVLYWLPQMIGLCILFYGVGAEERNNKDKYLIYYNLSGFFGLLAWTFGINELFDFALRTGIVFLILILTTTVCLLLYYYKNLYR